MAPGLGELVLCQSMIAANSVYVTIVHQSAIKGTEACCRAGHFGSQFGLSYRYTLARVLMTMIFSKTSRIPYHFHLQAAAYRRAQKSPTLAPRQTHRNFNNRYRYYGTGTLQTERTLEAESTTFTIPRITPWKGIPLIGLVTAIALLVLALTLESSPTTMTRLNRKNRLSKASASSDDEGTFTTTADPAASVSAPKTFNDGLPLPKLIVFDLDYTLWPCWCDTHVSGPVKATTSGLKVKDRYNQSFGFYSDVAGILSSIKEKNITLGAASRTCAPDLARSMLKLLRIPHTSGEAATERPTAISLFDHLEIYPGSKTTHFKKLQKATGISFEEMLFFDDESRNKNVEELGVVMWLVPDGVDKNEMDRGVESWRKRKGRGKMETVDK